MPRAAGRRIADHPIPGGPRDAPAVRRHGALCVNELDGLGVFLEVERMVPDSMPGEAVRAELSRSVASPGIDAEQISQTNDVLVRRPLASV